MADLLLRTSHGTSGTRVLVIGALDHRTADQFREQMSHLITNEETRRRLVVDLRCCSHADDDGSKAWSDVCAAAAAAGKQLTPERVPPLIDDCLRLTPSAGASPSGEAGGFAALQQSQPPVHPQQPR